MTNDKISKCERNQNWQATAKRADGRLVAVMRGQPGGELEGNFYLYKDDWTPRLSLIGRGMKDYSAGEINLMFSSGELSLIKGTIPTISSS
jgi:hypothetical protein